MEIENISEDAEQFTCNTYLIDGEIMVDPGTADSVKQKIKQIEDLKTVLITHSHYDHVDNLETVLENHNPDIYCFDKEELPVESEKTIELQDGEQVELDSYKIRAFHTPGHKDDHLCLYFLDEKILFAGDLIFSEGGFGRTDLDEGDRELLIRSIKKIIENTEPEKLYSGHGETIEQNTVEWVESSLKNAEKKEPKY